MPKPFRFCFILPLTALLSCDNRQAAVTPRDSAAVSVSADSIGGKVLPAGAISKPNPPKPVDQMDKRERDSYKEELRKAGYYDCCIRPTCTMCLYEDAEACPCAELIKKGEGVCGECHRGWHKGKGAVKGIDAKKVKRM